MKRLIIVVFLTGIIVPLGYAIYKELNRDNTQQATEIPRGNPLSQGDQEALSVLIENCYRWYVTVYASEQLITEDTLPEREMRYCFSDDFIDSWASVTSGGDPVLLAQDYFESWKSDFAFDFISQDGTEGYVKVSLGRGAELHQIIVQADKESGSWKIAQVRFP